MSKEQKIEREGIVKDVSSNLYKVQLIGSTHIVSANMSGKMRKNLIRVLIGDRVKLEITPYDHKRGRITYRFKS